MAINGIESVGFRLGGDDLVVEVAPCSPSVPDESGVVAAMKTSPVMQHCRQINQEKLVESMVKGVARRARA